VAEAHNSGPAPVIAPSATTGMRKAASSWRRRCCTRHSRSLCCTLMSAPARHRGPPSANCTRRCAQSPTISLHTVVAAVLNRSPEPAGGHPPSGGQPKAGIGFREHHRFGRALRFRAGSTAPIALRVGQRAAVSSHQSPPHSTREFVGLLLQAGRPIGVKQPQNRPRELR